MASLIDDLLTELLTKFFLALNDSENYYHDLCQAMAVCRSWRSVIEHCPMLWSIIQGTRPSDADR